MTHAAGEAPANEIRTQYGAVARRVLAGGGSATATACCDASASVVEAAPSSAASACGGTVSCCGAALDGATDPITADLYVSGESDELPAAAILASLGCGNPTALAELRAGETVLDLGSGGGIDVLLSARRVGPTGFAYGLDMTDDMLALARRNAAEAGVTNVAFLRGEIEAIPLPDASVDVIISNCVVNLSGDKARVLAEAWRVLRPGGRLAISDVVTRGDLPPAVRASLTLWIGCVAGALADDEFRALLQAQGFVDIEIEPTRVYDASAARTFLEQAGLPVEEHLAALEGRVMAAFVRATRPAAA